MRIGVDIDGVLNNIDQWHLAMGTKYCLEHRLPYQIQVDQYLMKDVFSLTEEEADDFWKENLVHLVQDIHVREGASEVIQKLREMGHTIIILTARSDKYFPDDLGKMETSTRTWLENNHILVDEMILSSANKSQDCSHYQIDLMIEDRAENVLSISEKIPVLCFDAHYNQQIEKENVHRVYSWYEIYDYLTQEGGSRV